MLPFKIIIKPLFFTIFSILILASCQKEVQNNWKSNVIHAVKGDVAVVSSIDFMNIINKSDLMNSEFLPDEYKGMMNMYVLNTLKSDNLGFKIEGNNHVVLVTNKAGEFDYVFFMADVLDEKKMSKNLKFLIGGKKEIKDYNYLSTNEGIVFGWDDKNVIGVFQNPETKNKNISSITILAELLNSRTHNANSSDDIDTYLDRNDDFNAFIYLDTYSKMSLSLAGLDSNNNQVINFNNNHVILTGNINNGNILFESSLMSSENNNGISPFRNNPISSDYLNYLSNDGKLISFFLANINVEGLLSNQKLLFQNGDLYDKLNKLLAKFELKSDDLNDLITGEMSVSIIDLNKELEVDQDISDAFGSNEDDFFNDISEDDFYNFYDNYDDNKNSFTPKILMAIGIKNKSLLINFSKKFNLELTENVISDIGNEMACLLKDNNLFIGAPQSLLLVLNENGELARYPKLNNIETPIYGFINTDTALIPVNFGNHINNEFGSAYYGLLNEMKFIEFKSTSNFGSLEIVMENSEENALKILLNSFLKSFTGIAPTDSII
jgi:hypothetical protein